MQLPRLKVVLDETTQVEAYQTEGASPMSENCERGVDRIATAMVDVVSGKILRPASCRSGHHARPTPVITDGVEHPEVRGA